jgi:hypothetical protein
MCNANLIPTHFSWDYCSTLISHHSSITHTLILRPAMLLLFLFWLALAVSIDQSAAFMVFNKKHNRFHAGLACALYDHHYRNKFLTIQSIAVIFNAITPDGRVATDAAVARALRGAKNAEFNMNIGLKGDLECSDQTVLVSREIKVGKGRFQCVGCFDTQQDIWNESRIRSFAKSNPAPIKIVGRMHTFAIPPRIQTGIDSYSNDHFPTVLEALEMGSPSKRQRPGTAGSSSRPNSANSHKRGRPNTPATEQPGAEISRLRKSLGKQMKERKRLSISISSKLTSIKNEMVSKSVLDYSIALKMARLKELGVNVSSEEPQDPKQSTKMYFTLSNGKGGMMELDLDRGVVLTSGLLSRLIVDESDETDSSVIDDATSDREDEPVESENNPPPPPLPPPTAATKKKERKYVYNKCFNCWVPKWKVLVHGNRMSNLQKDAIAAKKFMGLFKGQRCRLSNRSKDIITASSIAAAGASDKGVQSVIFGTLKAVAKEMGVKLSHKQLANGCPSVKSLRNWEFNLAAGFLAEVINQITIDVKRLKQKYGKKVKLQITLVTDHGNRDGFDHLVKMICWSSHDENGNHCLRHFNLDIDKGGHTTKAAAAAVYHLLKALCVDECDATFSWICGDSGGGAKVQAMWPELVDLGIMPEISDFVNCVLHAFNLSYETACKDSLGEPGMNKCNTFQLCYLAILLINATKKDTSIKNLKEYYNDEFVGR